MKKVTKKRGRPPTENPALDRLEIRITSGQRKRWQKAADSAGTNLSTWIKRILDKNS